MCGNDGFYLEVNDSPAWIYENINQANGVAENTVNFSADFFSLIKYFEKFVDQKKTSISPPILTEHHPLRWLFIQGPCAMPGTHRWTLGVPWTV